MEKYEFNKYEFMKEVMRLYDRIAELEELNRQLRERELYKRNPRGDDGPMASSIYQYGLDVIYKRAVVDYDMPDRYSDGTFESFENWAFGDKYSAGAVRGIPDFMSMESFKKLYGERLRSEYEERLGKEREKYEKKDEHD